MPTLHTAHDATEALTRRRLLRWLASVAGVALAAPVLSGCSDTPEVIVTGGVSADRAAAYRDLVLAAIPLVEDLWGWRSVPTPVRIDLPLTLAQWAAATGYRPDQRGYAASTVRSGQSEVRIVMHPDAWPDLSPQGRQAVITHEVTHLTMGPTDRAPWWIAEGLAEYTAHRRSTMSVAQIAGSALEQAAKAPGSSWPVPSSTGADAWQGYARAWLACVYLAERFDEEVLPSVCAAAAAGQPEDTWMPALLGETSSDLHRAWMTWLGRQ
ncbi:MAG: hypothetical protein WA962_02090 [Ornithinimicrobium sp.]